MGTDTSKTPILRHNSLCRGAAARAVPVAQVGWVVSRARAEPVERRVTAAEQPSVARPAAAMAATVATAVTVAAAAAAPGGPSYGIFVRFNTGTFTAPGTWTGNSASHGEAGAGGIGGGSIDSTNSGTNGANGAAANTNY